jgi:hypothetical protein
MLQQIKNIYIFKDKFIDSKKDTEAVFNHNLHKYKNEVSKFYKPDAIEHFKNYLNINFLKQKHQI